MWLTQSDYAIRCEWGVNAARELAGDVDAVIVVDVLSFSTCIDIAVSRNAIVFPFAWRDSRAEQFAAQHNAMLAGSRSRTQPSLSPTSLQQLSAGARLVLPSPNGATISGLTAQKPTFAACFRNARAVALAAQQLGARVLVIPAGERWPDDSMRPSLEDWLGAGAVITHLTGTLSPEATAARDAFVQHASRLPEVIRSCASGRELIDGGWDVDVEIAAECDVSETVPRLIDGAYR